MVPFECLFIVSCQCIVYGQVLAYGVGQGGRGFFNGLKQGNGFVELVRYEIAG